MVKNITIFLINEIQNLSVYKYYLFINTKRKFIQKNHFVLFIHLHKNAIYIIIFVVTEAYFLSEYVK